MTTFGLLACMICARYLPLAQLDLHLFFFSFFPFVEVIFCNRGGDPKMTHWEAG